MVLGLIPWVAGARQNRGGGPGPNDTVNKRYQNTTAGHFDDSWGVLRDFMNRQGIEGAPGGVYSDILNNYSGSPEGLQDFLHQSAPFVGASIQGTRAFKEVSDLNADDPMQAYGTAYSRLADSAQQGQQGAERMLTGSGLGRSGARAALAQNTAQTVGRGAADIYSNLYQERNRMRRVAAERSLDAHRMVASLALGHNPAPRAPQPNMESQALGALGNAVGTIGGSWLGAKLA